MQRSDPHRPTSLPRDWGSGACSALALVQGLLGLRVVGRLLRTTQGTRIEASAGPAPAGERLTVLVPVLDERGRLGPCLDGLVAQGPEVVEILVVDGGSTDGTPELVAAYAERDPRLRLVDASPVPAGWNGKAHGLRVGLERAAATTGWLLTVDADVRPRPALARSLLAFARRSGVPALSVATRQELSGATEGLLHPALLTTLVYRFGIPGHATDRVPEVQANGQCFLLRKDALLAVSGFAPTRDSLCEDVTLARTLAAAGYRVGFYETDDLVSVAMYAGWRDAWRNWTRSLPLRDRYSGWAGWLGLAEVTLVQALPLPLAAGIGIAAWWRRAVEMHPGGAGSMADDAHVVGAGLSPPSFAARPRFRDAVPESDARGWRHGRGKPRPDTTPTHRPRPSPPPLPASPGTASTLFRLNVALAAVRLGVLVGTARAYVARPWTYWLSPVSDLPAAVGVWLSAGRRRHQWRGRSIVRGDSR